MRRERPPISRLDPGGAQIIPRGVGRVSIGARGATDLPSVVNSAEVCRVERLLTILVADPDQDYAYELGDVEQFRMSHPAAHPAYAWQQRADGDEHISYRNPARFGMAEETYRRIDRAADQRKGRQTIDERRHAADGLPGERSAVEHFRIH